MMEEWLIDGFNLESGKVEVAGFKHALVSVVAACIACRGRLQLVNAPDILETHVLALLLHGLGAHVTHEGMVLSLDCRDIDGGRVDPSLSESIHGSIYLVPAILAANRVIEFRRSGGCAIGDGSNGQRPIDHVLEVLRQFGASFASTPDGWLRGTPGRWRPVDIDIKTYSDNPVVLTGPLVSGATKTALIAAMGPHEGCVTISNPYPKPDVTDLLRFAEAKGMHLVRTGSTVQMFAPSIEQSSLLTSICLTPDLSEIMTYLTLGVMTGTRLDVHAPNMKLARQGLEQECLLLEQMGVFLEWFDDRVRATAPEQLRSLDIEVTSVGIYSDHQPFFALLLTRGHRPATIREHVWKSRFGYIEQLRAFGVKAERNGNSVTIKPGPLSVPRQRLLADDLRMAAVLLVASLSVRKPCRLAGAQHLHRGYGQLQAKLSELGATIEDIGAQSHSV